MLVEIKFVTIHDVPLWYGRVYQDNKLICDTAGVSASSVLQSLSEFFAYKELKLSPLIAESTSNFMDEWFDNIDLFIDKLA